MKKRIITLLLVCSLLGCSKKDSGGPFNPGLETYPQEWILTIDENTDRYTHIEVIGSGNNTKRSLVDKSYSLILLADERECKFKISQSRNEANNKDCYKIQSIKNKKRWLFAGLSTNKQEVHLGCSNGSSEIDPPGDSDNYKFFIYNMEKVNGVKTVVIESVEKPGYYISSSQPGFNYSPTQVVLQKETSPEKATHWQCR
jgi:hypothetical protein